MRTVISAANFHHYHNQRYTYSRPIIPLFFIETMNNPIIHHSRSCYRLVLLALTFSLVTFSPTGRASLPQASNVPGGLAVVPLASVANTSKPQAWLGKKPILVTSDQGVWYAVVGLSLKIALGPHELRVSTDEEAMVHHFSVEEKDYPEQRITLKDKGKVDLSPKNLKRVGREFKVITGHKKFWSETPDTDLDFILPSKGKISSRFGLRRFFNDKPRNPHSGLDLAIKKGSLVKASSSGTVLAADNYFFNGNTVFVDHGNGLVTMYCHLDKFKVIAGQPVEKGDVIGLSGMTGRATGPHLHWSVMLNGTMVNPELFIQ